MDVASQVAGISLERALFGLGAVVAGALTVLVIANGGEPIQVVLFGAFALYLLGAALPQIHERVPEYRRTGGMALGGVGAIGFLVGTSSLLPMLFVIGGLAAFLRLM